MIQRKAPRRVLAISAFLGIGAILVSCAAGAPSQRSDEQNKECTNGVLTPANSAITHDPQHTHYSIYIEVVNVSSSAISDIMSQIEPFIGCAVREESFLRIVLDAGEGTEAQVLNGLDGSEIITAVRDLNRKNDRGENKAREQGVDDISREVRDAIELAEPAPTGSATRLLSLAASDAANMKPGDQNIVLLWSPLLGTSSSGEDCLTVTGVEADDANAAALVDRCVAQGLIQPINTVGVKLVGVGYGSTDANQQRFASQIQEHLYSSIFEVSREG